METLKFIILLFAAIILGMITLYGVVEVLDCVVTFIENRKITREYIKKRKKEQI